jgi:uncharacterized protein
MQMTCPKCGAQMRQYERNGVTVDQCTECRGIFLDRGELERLVDAEHVWHGGERQPPQSQRPYRDYDSDEYPVYSQRDPGSHKRRKRGFLEELFD